MTRTPLDLDRGADLQIDAPLVPEPLQHLIPLAARWAFDAQNDQDDFVKRMLSERTTEVAAFNAAIDTHRTDIVQWATEAGLDKHKTQLSEADWAHPYWHFLTLLKIRELTGPAPEAWPGRQPPCASESLWRRETLSSPALGRRPTRPSAAQTMQ